jgi:hypothetical protein
MYSGPEREKVAGNLRKSRMEEFLDLESAQNFIRVNRSRTLRWTECVPLKRGGGNARVPLVVRREGNNPLERSGHRSESKIKLDLKQELKILERIDMALEKKIMHN